VSIRFDLPVVNRRYHTCHSAIGIIVDIVLVAAMDAMVWKQVRPDIEKIIENAGTLREYGLKTIAMTTNGIVLSRKLPSLVASGLTAVNISLDTMDPHKFQIITRRKGHDRVLDGIYCSSNHVFLPSFLHSLMTLSCTDDGQ
jgi:hypothetical protein